VERAKTLLLANKVLPRRLAKETTFEKPILYFVPYLWYTATRPTLVTRTRTVIEDGDKDLDTRVNIDDFEAFRLAVEMPGWGLEGLDVGKVITGDDAPLLEPFDGTALRRRGIVLTPRRSYDDLESWARFAFPNDASIDASTDSIAERRRVLYLPIWNVGYTCKGHHYEARIDGVVGELQSARGPEDDLWRIPIALFAVAAPCFILGKLVRASVAFLAAGMGPTLVNPGVILTGIVSLLFGRFLFVALVCVAWSLLRFEADIVYEKGTIWSEQLGKTEVGRVGQLAGKSISLLAGFSSGPKADRGSSSSARSGSGW